MNGTNAIAELEHLAEAAYHAMYDARPYGIKDCYDAARCYFRRAIEAARQAGLAGEVARLERRLAHIESVYNHHFRGIGV